jgi:uncharacterized membrane protein
MTGRRAAARGDTDASATLMALALAGSGVGHFAAPARFDSVLPTELPGDPRCYTRASGFAEIGIAALLLPRSTRRLGGLMALSFFLLVTPVVVNGVRLARGTGAGTLFVALLRLPLQVIMIRRAHSILQRS